MNVSTKELRIQPGRIIDQVVNGEEITITFRGKPLARIVPYESGNQFGEELETSIFGMWKDHELVESVDSLVREARSGRKF